MDAINVGNKLVAHFWRANPGQFSRVPKMLGRPVPPAQPVPASTPKPATPTGAKPNAVVNARYDAKGKDTPWVHAYIRPVPDAPGQFTFENSEGEVRQGDQEEVALEFFKFDRALKGRGYTRMEFGNSSGNRAFDF
jgi:hypothetical protein